MHLPKRDNESELKGKKAFGRNERRKEKANKKSEKRGKNNDINERTQDAIILIPFW